jgi:beta-glucanase (GH16 family)
MIMKKNNFLRTQTIFTLTTLLVVVTFLLIQVGCKKEEAEYTPAFTIEHLDANHVQYTNTSTGEYYFMTWDFGIGETVTTTDKKESFIIYYYQAKDYDVSLRLTNYVGGNKTAAQTMTISQAELTESFTSEIDPDDPNYVILTNTSEGTYDAFKWVFLGDEVEGEVEYRAFFPLAGEYDIQLVINKDEVETSASQQVEIEQDAEGYLPGLIWSDEFNYSGAPDPEKWNMETGGGGWGNNELQYYTEENAYVDGGLLTITAKKESVGGYEYTSSRMTTQSKFDFQYGRIEARIKLPYGQGIWPAFWMLGANINTVGWPACGETDIMEMVGGPGKDNTVHCTLHWDNDGEKADYGQSYTLSSGIFADDFHIFSVTWDENEIKGYMDDNQYFVADITPEQLSEFHQNFFIILNMAVGGNWPGSPDASTEFPQTMEVDYVRVFQDEE